MTKNEALSDIRVCLVNLGKSRHEMLAELHAIEEMEDESIVELAWSLRSQVVAMAKARRRRPRKAA